MTESADELKAREPHEARIDRLDDYTRELRTDLEKVKLDGAIDYDILCSKDQYLELKSSVTALEQSTLTTNEAVKLATAKADAVEEGLREPL